MSPQRKPRQSLSSKANDATPFSQLTYLLQLITSLNFDENLSSSFHRAENAYHDDVASDSVGFTPLDSIAAILVQQHEVVAACYTSDQVSVIAADTIPATDIEVGQSPFASGSHTCHSLQLAALSNPDFSCSGHLDTSNLHNVQIETEGEDLWTKVQGSSRWYCAFMGPRPLKDHVATVSAYLNDYKSHTPETQAINARKFTCYLISTCWPKMARRIASWQAMGFMFCHSTIVMKGLDSFAQEWNKFPSTTGPGDRTLVAFLNALNDDLRRNVILDHCTDTTQSDFSLIFDKVSSSSPGPIFSTETALEFHKLTIAAFNGFASTFIRLKERSDKLTTSERTPLVHDDMVLTDRQTEVLQLLKRASTHYRFLLSILCSASFKAYFDMIVECYGVSSVLPAWGQKKLYFAHAHSILRSKDGEKMRPIGEVVDADSVVEADGESEDELFEEANSHSLFRFIKTFVIHLIAKRALERHCFVTKDQEVTISLFTVERSALRIPAGSWPEMQNILRASFSSESDTSTPTKAIKILQDKIQMPPEKWSPKTRGLLANLDKIIQGTPIHFPGGLHCETVLATLSKYYELSLGEDESIDNANLISTCKRLLRSGMISVSKLCCPVCWELLAILNQEEPLSLRGHHSTIFAVELPKWLPLEIVNTMNERFQKHLRQEIAIMLQGAEQSRRNRHVTHHSESNISVASTNFPVELESYE